MEIFHYTDIEAEEAEEGAAKLNVRWLITKDLGAKNFAMRLFEMEPGGFSPLHSHPWEHEVFILEGQGIIVSETKERRFKEGDVIFIPPNETHQLKNISRKNVRFLCLIPYKSK